MNAAAKNEIEVDSTQVRMTLPRLMAIIVTVACVVGSAVAGYVSIVSNQTRLSEQVAELTKAVVELRYSSQEDRFRGKDADRSASVFYTLNREKFPDLKVPIPTSVRDGNIELFEQ